MGAPDPQIILADDARSGSGNPYRTIIISTLGTVLEYYDFIIFVFFVKTIGQVFFPSSLPGWMTQVAAFGIFAAGYLARPFGGIVLAHYGDLLGRKRMFVLTIAIMMVASLGIAAVPTYASIGIAAPIVLLVLRLLQSAAVGGEIPGAWIFVAEHVPRHRMGLACAMMSSGIITGIFLGSLTAIAVSSWFSASEVQGFAWRLPFLASGCAGALSLFVRRYLAETPVFEALRQKQALAALWPVRIVLRRHWDGIAISFALGAFLTAGLVVLFLMTPTLLQTLYAIPPLAALQANLLATGVVVVSTIAAGLIVDRVGGEWFLVIGSIVFAASIGLLFEGMLGHPGRLLGLYAVAGFCSSVLVAVPYLMVDSFPPAVRFTGVALSYNAASAIFGGLTPIIVTYGLRMDAMAPMHYLMAACAMACIVGLVLVRRAKARA
jgi:MFS family permease